MALTWPVVLAVLCGAMLHAAWNALIKSGTDKAFDTALVTVMGALIALPLALWVGLPPRAAWPYIGASLVIHIGYYTALAGAYRHGELGLTYPIMRGLAPLLVALSSGALIGEVPAPGAWAGIVAIAAGVGLVGLGGAAQPGTGRAHREALAFAFANAAIIALYTVVDGRGVRSSSGSGVAMDATGSLRYVLWLAVLDALAYPSLVWWRQGAAGRRELRRCVATQWPLAALGGAAALASYAVALWAMTRAPVASVAALRETSVLFAAIYGTWLLKERFGPQRAIGTGVIVAGVMALRFA